MASDNIDLRDTYKYNYLQIISGDNFGFLSDKYI